MYKVKPEGKVAAQQKTHTHRHNTHAHTRTHTHTHTVQQKPLSPSGVFGISHPCHETFMLLFGKKRVS